MCQLTREDAGRRYVDSEMAVLELEQADTDRLASQLETQLRAVMKSGLSVLLTYHKSGQLPSHTVKIRIQYA